MKIDYHETTGHLRITRTDQPTEKSVTLRVLSQSSGPSNFSPISGTENLLLSTQACLNALKLYFKAAAATPDPESSSPLADYEVSIVKNSSHPPLPHEPLKLASTTSKDWVIARVTDFAAGTPSTAFTVASRFSQSILESLLPGSLQTSGASSTSSQSSVNNASPSKSPPPKPRTGPLSLSNAKPISRLRLHSSFASLSAKLQAYNPKMPVCPSNWRRDQRTLQQELDQWLCDILQIEPTHPALIAFITDEDDAFTEFHISSSYSYISLAFSSVMEAKPYRPLFPPSTPVKPLVLLFGASGTGKSAFVNQVIGFPICDPMGASSPSEGVRATIYEVLPPAAFAKIAALSSYWTHSLQFNISSYPPGSEILVVAPEKLQEPIHRLETSWKRGGAYILLDHDATLSRYKFASNLSHISSRTCIINEATLDPVRLEFDVARNNIFVEINHFESITQNTGNIGDSGDISVSSDTLGAEGSMVEPMESKTASEIQVDGLINATASVPLHLLEIAHFLTKSTRILHFGTLNTIPTVIKHGWMLEVAELLSANRDSFQFSATLDMWIKDATLPEKKRQLDLLKLLSLMSPWLNMLPTPRKTRHLLFMTPLTAPEYLQSEQILTNIAPAFKIHNIIASSARLIATRDLSANVLQSDGNANLVVSVNQSTPLATSSAYTFADAFDFLLPTTARDNLFQNALAIRSK